jgi:predicted nucleic acid-binding protein
MIAYLDTSAFVKLVIHEDGAEEARSWFAQAGPAITSVITYPEACSALSRRARRSDGRDARLDQWIAELDARWHRVVAVEATSRPAGGLALKHGLRGMDAVQLGSAMRTRERLREQGAEAQLLFAAFDRRLLEAAEREGFATLGGPLAS